MSPTLPKPKTPYRKWQDTVDQSKTDKRWNDHDALITSTVNEFNARLTAGRTGYRNLDWRLVKAMIWVESGGPGNLAWTTRPMQIGNPGDPGLSALLSGKEGGDLILTSALKLKLQQGASTAGPNIQAGVAYLLMRAATFSCKSVPNALDKTVYEVAVKAGDNLEKIATAHATTVDMLKALNPGSGALIKPGQKLKYQKASVQQVITGWQPITTDFAARKYNVHDPMYRQKLDYCLSLTAK